MMFHFHKWDHLSVDTRICKKCGQRQVYSDNRSSEYDLFHIEFIGFTGMGSLDQYEATVIIPPSYDISGVISSLFFADGSRGITFHFKRENKKLGRRGYSLKQEWEQLPGGQLQLTSSETGKETKE